MGKDDDMDNEITTIEGNDDSEPMGQIHRISQPRATPRTRLESLTCFPRVQEMVRAGLYTRKIAEFIQDMGEYNDVDLDTVIRAVRNYRKSLEDAGSTDVVDDTNEDRDAALYELDVMRKFFHLHSERIEMEVETEKGLRKLFSTTHKEFEVLEKLGSRILQLKKDLKLMDERGGRRGGGIGESRIGRLDMAEVASNAESRQKVLGAVEMIMGDSDLLQDMKDAGGLKGMMKLMAKGEVPTTGETVAEPERKVEEETEKDTIPEPKPRILKKKRVLKKKPAKKKVAKKKVAKKRPAKRKPASKRPASKRPAKRRPAKKKAVKKKASK